MSALLENEAKRLIKAMDVEAVRRALVAQMQSDSMDYLSRGKDEIFELFMRVRDNFDGSDYMQGKKDGLRSALALLGNVELESFNRGGGNSNPHNMDLPYADKDVLLVLGQLVIPCPSHRGDMCPVCGGEGHINVLQYIREHVILR